MKRKKRQVDRQSLGKERRGRKTGKREGEEETRGRE
jgi:hypothetical protein